MGKRNVESLESRPPTLEDLLELCKNLNQNNVDYMLLVEWL